MVDGGGEAEQDRSPTWYSFNSMVRIPHPLGLRREMCSEDSSSKTLSYAGKMDQG